MTGWYQMIAYAGFTEIAGGLGKDIVEGRPGQLGFTVLTSSDPAETETFIEQLQHFIKVYSRQM